VTRPPSTVVLAQVQLDDIRFPDGREISGQLGGAGSYAAVGAALACDANQSVAIVCGVGADLDTTQVSPLLRSGIDVTGMQVKDPLTPRSRILYRDEALRTEFPALGYRHFARLRPDPSDVPAEWYPIDAIFLFLDTDHGMFDRLERIRHRDTVILWEIDVACCNERHRAAVATLLPRVDWLSINLSEARSLVDRHDPFECIHELLKLGARRVSLRMGEAGALVADSEIYLHTGTLPVTAVDPTGAGNAHGGALLATWARTNDLEESAKTATAVASFVIEQFGLPATPPTPAVVATRSLAVVATRVGDD
jgi:sugar/nucleoside kinase (ribokinase family)